MNTEKQEMKEFSIRVRIEIEEAVKSEAVVHKRSKSAQVALILEDYYAAQTGSSADAAELPQNLSK